MTLLYPRWESTSHGPSLNVTALAGLVVEADGRPLGWRRDPLEPHAFHVAPPEGARVMELRYQILADEEAMAPDMVALAWQRLILYPAGWYARNIPVAASLTLPPGLEPVTALGVQSSRGSSIAFAPTTLETLLDSPVFAARHLNRIPLAAGGTVTLNLMARRAEDLAIPPDRIEALRRMIAQTMAVFGPPPFNRYEFLARMSDDGSVGGGEHRRSSEISLPSRYFHDWAGQLNGRDILPHELVHAWNGLYRTPADLWTATPNQPQGGSLLWVYEGQT